MSTPVSTGLLDRRRTIVARRHRRRRNVLFGAIVAAALLAGTWWSLTGPLVAVSRVNISGYDQPDQERIVRTVQIAARSGTMLKLPTVAVREALGTSPWVEGIELHHNWPRGVDVRITEATPAVVAITEEGRRLLVSTSGRVLGATDDESDLPRFLVNDLRVGSRLTGESNRAPFELLRAMEPDTARRVLSLKVEGGIMTATLASGLEVRFGSPAQAWEKGRALETMLNAETAKDNVTKSSYIDLTVPSRPMLGGIGTEETSNPQ